MSDYETPPRSQRFIAALPLLSALWLYGHVHERWLLVAPLGLAVIAAIAAGSSIERRPWHILVVIGIGAALGTVFLWASPGAPQTSALPPGLVTSMCGALACLACFVAVTERGDVWAWVYSWLLAGFCLSVDPVGAVWLPFAALILSTLACCFLLGGAARLGGPATLAFVVFVAVAMGTAYGLARLALRSERTLLALADKWARDLDPLTGLAIKSSINLALTSDLELSDKPIFELTGKPPTYLRTMVLDQFDGVSWRPDRTPTAPGSAPTPAHSAKLDVLLFESLDDLIPAPAGTYEVEGAKARPEMGWNLARCAEADASRDRDRFRAWRSTST